MLNPLKTTHLQTAVLALPCGDFLRLAHGVVAEPSEEGPDAADEAEAQRRRQHKQMQRAFFGCASFLLSRAACLEQGMRSLGARFLSSHAATDLRWARLQLRVWVSVTRSDRI